MRPKRILAVANNPGGVSVILPVVEQLRLRGFEVVVWLVQYGAKICASKNIPFTIVDAGAHFNDIVQSFDTVGPDVLLTGTSFSHTPLGNLENWCRIASRLKGVYSVGVVDFWSNYRARWSLDHELKLEGLPDVICAMDSDASAAMIECGIPAGIISVTGSPYLDAIVERNSAINERDIDETRNRLIKDRDVLVTFCSQPLKVDYGVALGFDEYDALEMIVKAGAVAKEKGGRSIKIVVRPHPRDDARVFEPFNEHIEFYTDPDPYPLIRASSLTLGVFNMLLVEAHLIGRPSVSIQPVPTFSLPYSIPVVSSVGEVADVFCQRANVTSERPKISSCAQDRIIELLERGVGAVPLIG